MANREKEASEQDALGAQVQLLCVALPLSSGADQLFCRSLSRLSFGLNERASERASERAKEENKLDQRRSAAFDTTRERDQKAARERARESQRQKREQIFSAINCLARSSGACSWARARSRPKGL